MGFGTPQRKKLCLLKQFFCLIKKECNLRFNYVPDRIGIEAVIAMDKDMPESNYAAMLRNLFDRFGINAVELQHGFTDYLKLSFQS